MIHQSSKIKDANNAQRSKYIRCPYPDDVTFRPLKGGPSAPTERLSCLYTRRSTKSIMY